MGTMHQNREGVPTKVEHAKLKMGEEFLYTTDTTTIMKLKNKIMFDF
jgi:hypothetical protein